MAAVPHLLLVCPRSDVLGKLLGLPVALTVVHRPGGDRALEESLAARVVDADFQSPEALLAVARDVHAWRPVDAVLGLTELSLYPVGVVADALGARGNAAATVACAQDKAAMRRLLHERGVSTTAHRVCTDAAQAAEFARACPAGIVLKPVQGNGGTGVHVVRHAGELAAAWAWTTGAKAAWAWSKADAEAARATEVLAEELLTGSEFSVETLTVEGRHQVLAVTRKHTTGPPHFVETGHDLPAALPAPQHTAVVSAALAALDAIGYAWGPCHTEVMLADDGERATVIEINVRQGGDQIWELVQHVTGIDMIYGAVAALAHAAPPPPATPLAGGAAIRYLAPAPGLVTAVEGLADALAVEGVIRAGELPSPGDEVAPLGDSWNRCGHVIATGPDPKSAAAAAEAAVARIVIRTERQPEAR
ncbi:ATP-grasp domain-containing protein [Streptomyces sp. NPDC026206]|uniref:ATP-grasp domain-containing protein n=1 Tax=Streptomyces sp. NPDC026206 TaxID=3157089 RepID=UPI00340E0E53